MIEEAAGHAGQRDQATEAVEAPTMAAIVASVRETLREEVCVIVSGQPAGSSGATVGTESVQPATSASTGKLMTSPVGNVHDGAGRHVASPPSKVNSLVARSVLRWQASRGSQSAQQAGPANTLSGTHNYGHGTSRHYVATVGTGIGSAPDQHDQGLRQCTAGQLAQQTHMTRCLMGMLHAQLSALSTGASHNASSAAHADRTSPADCRTTTRPGGWSCSCTAGMHFMLV